MKCSAFCLTSDPELGGRAEAAAETIDRMRRGKVTRAEVGRHQVIALPLEPGSGLPVVHGWLRESGTGGECSMLSRSGDLIFASRDLAGTRPLYVADSGRWVASDRRFFPGDGARLLPQGSAYEFEDHRVRATAASVPRFEGSFEDAAEQLAELIEESVAERVRGVGRAAVAFSGGLDSSMVAFCAAKHTRVLACSVNAEGSQDSTVAPRAAEMLGVEFLGERVTAGRLERELSSLSLPFEPSLMDRSLWCIYSIASRAASESGSDLILLGQLADELFGGYMKYSRAMAEDGALAAEALMRADFERCGERGLLRDEAASSRWAEPRFPFADRRVVDCGRSLPAGFKVREGVRKAVLREAASILGVPQELVAAPKKAAQYSSGVQRILA